MTTITTYIFEHVAKVNVAAGTVESMQTESAVAKRIKEIKAQLNGLDIEAQFNLLEDLRNLFYKRLCRAKHSHMNPAIADAKNLLAAIRSIKVELVCPW